MDKKEADKILEETRVIRDIEDGRSIIEIAIKIKETGSPALEACGINEPDESEVALTDTDTV